MKQWELISTHQSNKKEVLILIDGNGRTVREYSAGIGPYANIWTCYSYGFPVKEFTSREACIRDAHNQALPFPCSYRPDGSHGVEL